MMRYRCSALIKNWTAIGGIAALLPVTALAQAPPAPLWSVDSIRSQVLGQTRSIRIALPRDYNDPLNAAERYPVLIVLDAQEDVFFAAAIANAQALGFSGSPMIPQPLIVGVVTEAHRYHDMAPTPPDRPTSRPDEAGGAPDFLKFLSTELRPFVSAHYRTASMTILAGHSMSGLFTTWAYAADPSFVNAAIALSPSFLEYNGYFAEQIVNGIARRSNPGALFAATGDGESVSLDSAGQAFAAEVRTRASRRTSFEFERLPGASHGNTWQQGMIDGLQFIFRGMSLAGTPLDRRLNHVPATQLIRSFEETQKRYASAAREFGLSEQLPMAYMVSVAIPFFPDSTGAPVLLRICQQLVTDYPERWNGYACSATAHLHMGDTTTAVANYEHAMEAARRAGYIWAVDQMKDRLRQLRVPRTP